MKEFEFTYRTAEEAIGAIEEEPESEHHSTFDLYEKGMQVEHTIPLGNLLLHTAEGRIVGIEIFERANEILGTWEADEDEDWEDRPLGGRWFMQEGNGVYANHSHAEIVAEDEGCDECGAEVFEEERVRLDDDKNLICEVRCQECGWVHDTVKR